jgi:ketosteroid isomerase-like protein
MIAFVRQCTGSGGWSLTGALRCTARVVAVAAVLFVAGCWIEVEEDETNLQSYVQAMLEESADAWNRGDLEGFMDDYLRSANTTYIGSAGLLTGHEAIRDRFAPHFEPGVERDSLRFEDLRTRMLGAVDGLAIMRYVLHRGGEVTESGPVTLVLRRTSAGWRIIHDHSSSDASPSEPLAEPPSIADE